MVITQISYSKTVESQVMGAGIWTKVGVTGNVQEGEDISSAIEQAKVVVEDAIQKAIPPPMNADIIFKNVTTGKMEY